MVGAELFRALRPGGHLQLAFHVGLVTGAEFEVLTQVLRDPAARMPQGRVLARKPAD
ncbi:hypothetical protein [Amycolatopsis sp. NPDC051061]|uniref:hypothetical protein n=1 Tax=Amycolatopsis sp. NPDC051061 TaxID=3155042 RepID=UPI0034258EB0